MTKERCKVVGTTALALLVASCGGQPSGEVSPEGAEPVVRAFLAAVSENSLLRMGDLWGGSRGPASGYMEARELEQRLTIMRVYLEHESFTVLPGDESIIVAPGNRVLRVQLMRRGCTPIVPFTLTQWRDRWLVTSIDLNAIGNPARSCRPGGP